MSLFPDPSVAAVDAGLAEEGAGDGKGALEVLLTATTAVTLEPFRAAFALPAYRYGPKWHVRPAGELAEDEYFDLAIVLCANSAQLEDSVVVAGELAVRRNLTILLVPATLAADATVPGATVLTAPGSLADVLALFGTVVLAATQHEGDVCCDLADIIAVLDASSRGELFACEAPTAKEAIAGLNWEMRRIAANGGYGAVLTLQHGHIREWYILMNMVKDHVQENALVVGSHPQGKSDTVIAAAMVLTAPAPTYARRQEPQHRWARQT